MSRLKHIYTADVGRPLRWLTIAALAVITPFMALSAAFNIYLLCAGRQQYPLEIVLAAITIAVLVAAIGGWMLFRLVRGTKARNGRTVMPEWFIQAFGVLLLSFLVLIAITDRRPWRLVEATAVAIAMIGIRKLLRASDLPTEQQGHNW